MPETPRQPRLRFSLLNIVFLMTTAAACFGLYAAREKNRELETRFAPLKAEMQSLEDETARIRAENGYLTIGDSKLYHAVRLLNLHDDTWTYRVYLPPGRNYFAACKFNDLPLGEETLPSWKAPGINTIAGQHGGVAIGVAPGEYLVTLSLYKDANGGWAYKFNVRSSQQKKDAGSKDAIGGSQLADISQWPYASTRAFAESGVMKKIARAETKKPFVLLNFRAMNEQMTSSAESTEGVAVWIHAAK